MQHYQLKTTISGTTLFEGTFPSFKACLETAIEKKHRLPNIDLRNRNLVNANLDNAIMPGADFSGSNLSGANLSESYLNGALFKHTALYNTCLAYSNMLTCDFHDALFGATDITGALLSRSRFSTLSCFTLNFASAGAMDGCVFENAHGQSCSMSQPPITINGLTPQPVVIFDNTITKGHQEINATHLRKLSRSILHRLPKHPERQAVKQTSTVPAHE